MNINKLITPYNRTVTEGRRIEYIVIHYVGATGSAQANCKYFASKKLNASAHYFVGHEGEIWQSVEEKDAAWHSGGKSFRHPNARNSNSLGIELCCRNNGSWYFEQATINTAVELVKSLMSKYGIPIENVIRHYDVTGKICPQPMVSSQDLWNDFKSALGGAQVKPLPPKPQAQTGLLKAGSRGQEVTDLQNKLNALGYNCGKADGIFGKNTKSAVCRFQRASGLAVDGIVGKDTRNALNNSGGNSAPQPGSGGTDLVRQLQTELNKQYGAGLAVDGIFGSRTLGACPTVKKGARGNITLTIQKRLKEHNCFEGSVDGIFGSGTQRWVKDFQAYYKLSADGIVGKNTWSKLF